MRIYIWPTCLLIGPIAPVSSASGSGRKPGAGQRRSLQQLRFGLSVHNDDGVFSRCLSEKASRCRVLFVISTIRISGVFCKVQILEAPGQQPQIEMSTIR